MKKTPKQIFEMLIKNKQWNSLAKYVIEKSPKATTDDIVTYYRTGKIK